MENEKYKFDTVSDRVRYCADLVGTPSRLASLAGMSRSQVKRVLTGGDITTQTASRIAKVTGVDAEWMLHGIGLPQATRQDMEVISIRVYGGDHVCPIGFQKNYFESLSKNPDQCRAFKIDESYHEQITKGSWCIFEEIKSDKDGEYLIEYLEKTQIRFLEFLPDGSIRVQANKKQQEFIISNKDIGLITVVGKVVWAELKE